MKPKGSDFRNELEAAMPQALSGRRPALPATDPVAIIAEQLQAMSEADRTRLMEMMKPGGAE